MNISADSLVGRGKWVFLSKSSLPSDPEARRIEKRGRWWLVASYFFCPCHLPIALAIAGGVLGGTALGATISGNTIGVGVVLTAMYALLLWRGFHHIRIAKRLVASGETLVCTPTGCEAREA
ncbi:MAG: hypothetical protein ABIR58_06870 [Gemmatimonadaceae bacterium]